MPPETTKRVTKLTERAKAAFEEKTTAISKRRRPSDSSTSSDVTAPGPKKVNGPGATKKARVTNGNTKQGPRRCAVVPTEDARATGSASPDPSSEQLPRRSPSVEILEADAEESPKDELSMLPVLKNLNRLLILIKYVQSDCRKNGPHQFTASSIPSPQSAMLMADLFMSSSAVHKDVRRLFGGFSTRRMRAPQVTCGSMLSPAGGMTFLMRQTMQKIQTRYARRLSEVSCEADQLRRHLRGKGKGKLPTVTDNTPVRKRGESMAGFDGISSTVTDVIIGRAEIVRWVAENLHPFKIVENQSFHTLMKTGRPEYYLPSADTVSRDVRHVFTRTRNRIAKMLRVSI